MPQTRAQRLSRTRSRTARVRDFVFICQIYKGKYRSVYLVSKLNGFDSGKLYAMKTLDREYVEATKDRINLLSIERDIMNALAKYPKPNPIVNLIYYFTTNKHIFMISEFYGSSSLYDNFEIIRFLPRSTKAKLLAELVLLVNFVHSCGITHRDLKLKNIVCDRRGHLKVIDFELAARSLFHMKEQNGTPIYMAPEMLQTPPISYNYTIDYWSVGIIAYEIISGNLYNWMIDNDKFLPDDFDKHLLKHMTSAECSFICNLLNKNPNERLGAHGIKEFYHHPYFVDVNWNEIKSQNYILFTPHLYNVNKTIDMPEEFYETPTRKKKTIK